MNERIKELAEQVYGSAHHDDFKFAELIVLECLDVVDKEVRDRLAQPEQEPVMFLNNQPLYITPPQRQWVGLTDEEIDNLYDQHHNQYGQSEFLNYERAIETKLREKNT
jgi:hypothetical protein